MGSHSVRTRRMYQYCVLYLSWWWFSELKYVAEILILITTYIVLLTGINYYINKICMINPSLVSVDPIYPSLPQDTYINEMTPYFKASQQLSKLNTHFKIFRFSFITDRTKTWHRVIFTKLPRIYKSLQAQLGYISCTLHVSSICFILYFYFNIL